MDFVFRIPCYSSPRSSFVQGKTMLGVVAANMRFRYNDIIKALLATLATLTSTLSPVFKAMPWFLFVETFGVFGISGEEGYKTGECT